MEKQTLKKMSPLHPCSSLSEIIVFPPVLAVFSFYGFIQSYLQFWPKAFNL